MQTKEGIPKLLQSEFQVSLLKLESSSEKEFHSLQNLNREAENIKILLDEINLILHTDEKNVSVDLESHRGLKTTRTVANLNMLNKTSSLANMSSKTPAKRDKSSITERNNKSIIEDKSSLF